MITSSLVLIIGICDVIRCAPSTSSASSGSSSSSARTSPLPTGANQTAANAPERPWHTSWPTMLLTSTALAGLLCALLGLDPRLAALMVGATMAWVHVMPSETDSRFNRQAAEARHLAGSHDLARALRKIDRAAGRIWPALLAVSTLTVVTVFDSTMIDLPPWLQAATWLAPRTSLSNVTPETAFAVIAVLFALTQTSNLVTRAALGHRSPPVTAPTEKVPDAPGRWVLLSIGKMRLGSVTEGPQPPSDRIVGSGDASGKVKVTPRILRSEQPEPRTPNTFEHSSEAGTEGLNSTSKALPHLPLRGGRHIGPIERILVMSATLAGAYPVVAGILAAKGIVRFPEISEDRASGGKAEEFLVGSLTSWTIAWAAALYLALVTRGP